MPSSQSISFATPTLALLLSRNLSLYNYLRYDLADVSDRVALVKAYGRPFAVFMALLAPRVSSQYEIIHRSVLYGKEEEIMTFRQAILDECNMTAVAVSKSECRRGNDSRIHQEICSECRRVPSSPKLP